MQKQGLGCKNWEEQNKTRKSWPETQAFSCLYRARSRIEVFKLKCKYNFVHLRNNFFIERDLFLFCS